MHDSTTNSDRIIAWPGFDYPFTFFADLTDNKKETLNLIKSLVNQHTCLQT